MENKLSSLNLSIRRFGKASYNHKTGIHSTLLLVKNDHPKCLCSTESIRYSPWAFVHRIPKRSFCSINLELIKISKIVLFLSSQIDHSPTRRASWERDFAKFHSPAPWILVHKTLHQGGYCLV